MFAHQLSLDELLLLTVQLNKLSLQSLLAGHQLALSCLHGVAFPLQPLVRITDTSHGLVLKLPQLSGPLAVLTAAAAPIPMCTALLRRMTSSAVAMHCRAPFTTKCAVVRSGRQL